MVAFQDPRMEIFRFIYPGPVALQAIEAKPSVRSFNLSELPTLKVCCWCNAMPIPKPLKRYCSGDCRESASLFCNPQSPAGKMYVLLQLQDCTCVGCGEIYDEKVSGLVDHWWRVIQERQKHGLWTQINQIPLWMLGQNTGDTWHVDHIIPIFRGGRGVCLENIQVLCVNCHKKKTARERR